MQKAVQNLHGLNFGPYTSPGQSPAKGPGQISAQVLEDRMKKVAGCTNWLRSFGSTGDLAPFGRIAHKLGKKAAVGAWLSQNQMDNKIQLDSLIGLAIKGQVDLAIVGSETLLRNDLPQDKLISHIRYVKSALQKAGIIVPVTTADVHDRLISHPNVIKAVDVVMANFYPFWSEITIDKALEQMGNQYQQMKKVAGKQVIVSETGWPSEGQSHGKAVPSPVNAARYFNQFIDWAGKRQIQFFYFEAVDEPWKISEGQRGRHWGIFDGHFILKPGFSPNNLVQ